MKKALLSLVSGVCLFSFVMDGGKVLASSNEEDNVQVVVDICEDPDLAIYYTLLKNQYNSQQIKNPVLKARYAQYYEDLIDSFFERNPLIVDRIPVVIGEDGLAYTQADIDIVMHDVLMENYAELLGDDEMAPLLYASGGIGYLDETIMSDRNKLVGAVTKGLNSLNIFAHLLNQYQNGVLMGDLQGEIFKSAISKLEHMANNVDGIQSCFQQDSEQKYIGTDRTRDKQTTISFPLNLNLDREQPNSSDNDSGVDSETNQDSTNNSTTNTSTDTNSGTVPNSTSNNSTSGEEESSVGTNQEESTQPINFEYNSVDKEVSFSWNSVEGASRYRVNVYMYNEETNTYEKQRIVINSTSKQNFTYSDVLENKKYKIEVIPRIGYMYEKDMLIESIFENKH